MVRNHIVEVSRLLQAAQMMPEEGTGRSEALTAHRYLPFSTASVFPKISDRVPTGTR